MPNPHTTPIPQIPPGILYGRGKSGCFLRNANAAENISIYIIMYICAESAMNTQKALLMVGVKNTTREINDIIVAWINNMLTGTLRAFLCPRNGGKYPSSATCSKPLLGPSNQVNMVVIAPRANIRQRGFSSQGIPSALHIYSKASLAPDAILN